MSKRQLKQEISQIQGLKDAITGKPLPDDPALFDTDRINEKMNGGTYTPENTRLLDPRTHMERHGILRERGLWQETLKSLMDERMQAMKAKQKIENQLLAFERRTDDANPRIVEQLTLSMQPSINWIAKLDKEIVKHFKLSKDPLVKVLLDVPGVGPITAAFLLVYIDLEKAQNPSSLWKYCGYHCASHERYTKGEAGGGNKTLRTVLFNFAAGVVKQRSNPYRIVYERTKARLEVSEKMTMSRNTQGKLIECMWKDTKPCHRNGAAMRAVIKHFLADFWMVGRKIRGLSIRSLYAEEYLGHTGIIKPEERGWKV